MKKMIRFSLLLFAIAFLAACGSKQELSDYVEVYFSGYDTIGSAHYTVDQSRLIDDAFGITEGDYWDLDNETQTEIEHLTNSYSINIKDFTELSNGDEIVVQLKVDEKRTDRLKTKDELIVEVAGLEELEEITAEELEKNVVVNFNGTSGRGFIQIDTTFSGDLSHLRFETEQDGEIKNGDTVRLTLTEDSKDSLASNGYKLAGNGEVNFEASGLQIVAENASDIENLEDITRMISEGINRQYQEDDYGRYSYEITAGNSYYRQFDDHSDSNEWGDTTNNGTYITLYTIEEYNRDGELADIYTAIFGFNNIVLDENNKTNVTRISEYTNSYDNTYSIESVERLMEGYGFELIE